jgi:beta-xylosidase
MPCGAISVPESCPLRLKMSIRDGFVSFAWAAEGEAWHLMGDEMGASFLSDEACNEGGTLLTGSDGKPIACGFCGCSVVD